MLAWSWGASNTVSATSGLTSAGKANLQDLSLTKYVDRSSPVIFGNLVTGKTIPKAKLTVVKAGENPLPYIRLCFTGVRFTSVSTGGSGGEDRLTENVSFAYATVVEAYQQQLAGGGAAPPVFSGWDLVNKLQFRDETC